MRSLPLTYHDYLFNPFSVLVGGIWTYKVEKEHKEHLAHERHENGGKLPEIPEYEFLNRRVKPFPWGNNPLFFNPEVCLFLILDMSTSLMIMRSGEQEHGS